MASVGHTQPTPNRTIGIIRGSTGPFNANNLNIVYTSATSGQQAVWSPGQDLDNLGGTYEELDCYSTPMECYGQYWTDKMQPGLLNRNGPVVIDDTMTARLTDGDPSLPITWPWWNDNFTTAADIYFHVYQNDYAGFLSTWKNASGPIAMPRRAALGLWWSRYWKYNATSIETEVLSGYANYSIPLSVLVMDMDWHDEPTDKTCSSWGNFDFNTDYFPDPQGFIAAVHNGSTAVGRPLELSLNVHPQSGVDHCDSRYAEVAARMGIDASTNITVPCDMGNQTFTKALYDIYYNALPLEGVDTWWTDYGGCNGPIDSNITIGAQMWSNVVYDNEIRYNASKGFRPMVLSRNGGIGTQRYPISFSGDTFQHEATLDFLIQTTPMASNALLPYWSHDVGGFHDGQGAPGDADPTNMTGSLLMLRWYQFAVVSPIFRTHCDHCVRTVWSFPYVFSYLKDAMVLRQALVPYIYSTVRQAYDTGVPLLRPMYYGFPNEANAYSFDHQFMFGDEILAAPLSEISWSGNGGAADNTTSKTVWLPSGSWMDWEGNSSYTGPTTVTHAYGFGQMPLFVSSGTLLALCNNDLSNVVKTSPDLVWTYWYPGATGTSSSSQVYEDDGRSLDYEASPGAVVTGMVQLDAGTGRLTLTVAPVAGSYPGMPSTRSHSFQVRAPPKAQPSTVTVNGAAVPVIAPGSPLHGWYIVPADMAGLTQPAGALVVNAGSVAMDQGLTVVVNW